MLAYNIGVLKKGALAVPEHFDDLDAYIAKRAAGNPAFPKMVDAALKKRRLLRELAANLYLLFIS